MREVFVSAEYYNRGSALAEALQTALPDLFAGVSTYGALRPVSVWLSDDATKEDETAVLLAVGELDVNTLKSNKEIEATAVRETAAAVVLSLEAAPDKLAAVEDLPLDVLTKALLLKFEDVESRLTALESVKG